MTVVDVVTKPGSWGRTLLLRCDTCQLQFNRPFQSFQHAKLHHFCNRRCLNVAKQKGNVVNQAFETTCTQRYGVVNPFQAEECKVKAVATLNVNYGGNVRNPSQVPEIRDKITATYVEHYGVDHPMKLSVERERRSQTLIERHGVGNAFTLAHKRGTAVLSFNDPHVRERALDARLRNGSTYVSTLERTFFDRIEAWGHVVQRQVRVTKWPIDALVDDVFVQHDGDHHHGIQERSKTYGKVREQMRRDGEQNEWFLRHGLKLLRIGSSVAMVLDATTFMGLMSRTSSEALVIVHSLSFR